MRVLRVSLRTMQQKLCWILVLWLAVPAMAQDTQIRLDSSVLKVPKGLRLIAERGFVLPIAPDSALQLRGRSGTTRVGVQLSAARRSHRWGFHLNPSFAWTGYHFLQDTTKTFPTTTRGLLSERHLLTWVDVPAGVSFHLGKGQGAAAHPWVEAGAWLGYQLAASYRSRLMTDSGQVVNTRISNIPGPQVLRAGYYVRAGYGDIALSLMCRLSGVYVGTGSYPQLPRWEAGILIRL